MTPTAAGIQNTVFLLEHISINLCNLVKKCFFSILICKESQKHFAFTWQV